MNTNKAELPRTLLHVKPLVIELDVDRDRARASPLQRRCQRIVEYNGPPQKRARYFFETYKLGQVFDEDKNDMDCPCRLPTLRESPPKYWTFRDYVRALKEGDAAFIYTPKFYYSGIWDDAIYIDPIHGCDGANLHDVWSYAIVIEQKIRWSHPLLRADTDYIIFQVTADGATRKIMSRDYEFSVRPLKHGHASYHPIGTTLVEHIYHPGSFVTGIRIEDDSDDITMDNNDLQPLPLPHYIPPNWIPTMRIKSINSLPMYENKSPEELRLENYMAENKVETSTSRTQKLFVSSRQRRSRQQSLVTINSQGLVDVDLGTRHISLEPPIRGAFYTQKQALYIIENTTVRGSSERSALIHFMAEYEFVPNSAFVYKILGGGRLHHQNENWGLTDEYNSHQSGEGLNLYKDDEFEYYYPGHVRDLDYPAHAGALRNWRRIQDGFKDWEVIGNKNGNFGELSKNGTKGWKGIVRFYVIPIEFGDADLLEMDGLSYLEEGPHYNMLTCLDICQYIGSRQYLGIHRQYCGNGKKSGDRTCKLYFPPSLFPPPTDMDSGGSNNTFHKLKSYIELVSEKEGSPVVCLNGRKEKHSKYFFCRENKRGIGKAKCPFKFQVRWDKHGYFVHLLSSLNWSQACGCPWHCCNVITLSPYGTRT